MILHRVKQLLNKASSTKLEDVAWNPSPSKDPYFQPHLREDAERWQQLFDLQRVIGMISPHMPIFETGNNYTHNDMMHEGFDSAHHKMASDILKQKIGRMNDHYKYLNENNRLHELPKDYKDNLKSLYGQVKVHDQLAYDKNPIPHEPKLINDNMEKPADPIVPVKNKIVPVPSE
jgi:hypothetical protein